MYRPCFHKCRQLESERFATSCREDGEEGLAFYRCFCRVLLQWFAVIGAELVISEDLLQIIIHVEKLLAVIATFEAIRVSETLNYSLYVWIMIQNPRRRDGIMLCSADESEGKSQFYRLLNDNSLKVSVLADLSMIDGLDKCSQFFFLANVSIDHCHKAMKLLYIVEQCSVNALHLVSQRVPFCQFVHHQVAGFGTVIDGIIHLFANQFVIFQQMMIRAIRKEQR